MLQQRRCWQASRLVCLLIPILLTASGCFLIPSTVGLPVVGIAASPKSGVAPFLTELSAVFSKQVSEQGLSYSWDLGDGTTHSGKQIQHTYTSMGRYNVCLTVTDVSGEICFAQTVIIVSDSANPEEDLRDLLDFGDHVIFWHDQSGCRRVAEAIWVQRGEIRIEMLKDTHEFGDEMLILPGEEFAGLSEEQEQQLAQVPDGYYDVEDLPPVRTKLAELVDVLANFRFPHGYISGFYEETHMAAYLEVVLENQGFDARIAVGPHPIPRCDGLHAWVLVYIAGTVVAVEPTYGPFVEPASALVFTSEPSICPYYVGSNLEIYHDIYVLAVTRGIGGFDWW